MIAYQGKYTEEEMSFIVKNKNRNPDDQIIGAHFCADLWKDYKPDNSLRDPTVDPTIF